MTKHQKTEVARLVLLLGTWAMLSIMMLHKACAQDSRWSLMPGRDSLAIGPLEDVRRWAGLRVAKNFQARQCAWELAERSKEIAALRSAIDHGRVAAKLNAQLVTSQADEIARMGEHNRKLARKVKRRNPALWMGIGAGIVVVIQTQMR